MKKIWLPLEYSGYDTQSMGELFERFAKKGWHFHRLNASNAVFIKGEKETARYTVDLFSEPRKNNDDEKLSEYRDLCESSGWDYVDGYNEFQVFKAKPGIDPMPLQSDDDLAAELVYEQQLRRSKENILGILLVLLLVIISAILFPLDILEDNFSLAFHGLVPIFGFAALIWEVIHYIKIKKSMHDPFNTLTLHSADKLMMKSIASFIFTLFVLGGSFLYVVMKYLHQESLNNSIYIVTAFVNMMFYMSYNKRNEGRKIKIGKSIKIFVLSFIGCTVLISAVEHALVQPAADKSRIISVLDPAAEGTFTKGSSYFIPYQCEFVSDLHDYQYNLYIAKDQKTSDAVFEAVLAQGKKWDESEKLKDEDLKLFDDFKTVQGYYRQNTAQLFLHLDQSVIVIKGFCDSSICISRFKEQLNMLDLTY